jgi:hypothetical protein
MIGYLETGTIHTLIPARLVDFLAALSVTSRSLATAVSSFFFAPTGVRT